MLRPYPAVAPSACASPLDDGGAIWFVDDCPVGGASARRASSVHPLSVASIASRALRRGAVSAGLIGALLGDPGAARAEPLAHDPECLAVTQSSQATYMIENSACPDKSVLAAIELPGEGVLARCFTKKIRSQISIASESAVPVINYQCLEGTPGCSVDELRGMFPECHSG